MRTIEIFEAVTFPNTSEILVRRRSAHGGMKVLARIPRHTDTPAPLHEAMITALNHSRWQAISAAFLLPGEEHGTAASGVKVEVASRYEHPDDPAPATVPLTEDHREALTDEAVRFYTQIDEPVDGLDDYSTAAAGSLIWDARLLPIRFTGHRDRCGDLVRAHTVADTGLWTPAADRATDLDNHVLTARVLWQLICELSD